MSTAPQFARLVVLAGGQSRRLGHDKLAAALGTSTVLDSLLDGLDEAHPDVPVTVVGRARPTSVPVTWRWEEPAGGGPVAGVLAGIEGLADPDLVAVLAGDLPFAAPALAGLLAALGDTAPQAADAVLGVDPSGADQPLLSGYRVGPLRLAIGEQAAGRSVRSVVSQLAVVRLPLAALWCLDVDTAADLAAARALRWAP